MLFQQRQHAPGSIFKNSMDIIRMQIFKNVFLVHGSDTESNIYIIDGEVIVDTGTGENFQHLKDTIIGNFDPSKLRTVINTHCHHDHTGGNRRLRALLRAEIAAHEYDKPLMESGKWTLSDMLGLKPMVNTVDIALKDGSVIKTKNFSFSVVSTPGHTPGSICLYDREKKLLFSGDTILGDGTGRTDMPGGSQADLMASLRKLSCLNISYLFPGHGPHKIGGVNLLIRQMLHMPRYSAYF